MTELSSKNRFRVAERQQAVQRGLESIYRVACDPSNFAEYPSDLLLCFYLISSTSKSIRLRRMALEMGHERASYWRGCYGSLPKNVDAGTIMEYLTGCGVAEKLGVSCRSLRAEIKAAAPRFKVTEFICFNPKVEPPPNDATDVCECGLMNNRGRKTCRLCKRRLVKLNRYEVGFYAMTWTYFSDSFGFDIGASFADVLRWLPGMRPYRGREKGRNPIFYDTVYFVTHVVYTLNAYGVYKISWRLLPDEFQFLKDHLHEAIAMDDPEMVGEFLDSLKAFGMTEKNPIIRTGVDYLLSRQNPDGSWGDCDPRDTYMRYHATWTAIDGLRDYVWREGLSFPDLKPLLKRSA